MSSFHRPGHFGGFLRTSGGTINGNLAVTGTLAVTGAATFSGQLLGPNGTAAAPTFGFSGDAGNGLFLSAADIVSIAVGTVRRYVFQNTASAGFVVRNAADSGTSFSASDTLTAVSSTSFTVASSTMGFYGAAAVAQGAAVADASGGATVDAEARTAINTLLARIRSVGLIAT